MAEFPEALVDGRFRIERLLKDTRAVATFVCIDEVTKLRVVCRRAAKFEHAVHQWKLLVSAAGPGLVQPLGFFRDGAFGVTVLEFLDGKPFEDWVLDKAGRQRLHGIALLVRALRRMHERGGAHGDPQAVFDAVRGPVLIDPVGAPEFAKTGEEGERRDVELLGRTILDLLPSSPRFLRDRVEELLRRENPRAALIGIEECVTNALRDIESFPPSDFRDVGALAATRDAEVRARGVAWSERRIAVFRTLIEQTRELCDELVRGGAPAFAVRQSPVLSDWERAEREAMASHPRPSLANIEINFDTANAFGFDVFLDNGGEHFPRPWPTAYERIGLLAQGGVRLRLEQTHRARFKIVGAPDVEPEILIVDPSPGVLGGTLNAQWLKFALAFAFNARPWPGA